MFIHQAHPGELRHRYSTFDQKLEGAREYKEQEQLPWPVLVDDLAGTMHREYSQGMADPTFLIDVDGQVSFYGMWTHVPTLHRAITALLSQDGRGQALGLDRTPHLLASFVDGYRGPRRGGRRGVLEYDLGGGGAGTLSFLGNKAKPVLAPVALRSTPLPRQTKLAVALGLASFVLLGASVAATVLR
ncbi:MAG: hypothetical protein AVDCRST_MAG76-718 [uncultured Acidimicrobiales bacterium]|uniref:Thioredoxin-like fold domain-containing protein n=1 Tax=uncultured Acidimicrobiales bacterium TaxID=310071 RepID=A0A6J4HG07_9ACTN|nr:MAG: hypothetical protein AVDCRST_MAG76-718 [uncultured Acidimicrobiales bacterium]